MVQGSTTIQRQVIMPCDKSFSSHSGLRPSLACVNTVTQYTATLRTDTTLDFDDEQVTVKNWSNLSAHFPLQKRVWLF